MTLNVVSKSRVEGDDNLSIQLDRGKIKYSIAGKHLNIEIEHGIGAISVFEGSITKWFPPFNNVKIGQIEKQAIIRNVREAMKLLGVDCVIE